jgi:hypothetical protein
LRRVAYATIASAANMATFEPKSVKGCISSHPSSGFVATRAVATAETLTWVGYLCWETGNPHHGEYLLEKSLPSRCGDSFTNRTSQIAL